MYTYVCCRCVNCEAQIPVDESGSDEVASSRPSRPRTGREVCPYCRTVFVPESYYVTESETPLLQRVRKASA